MVGLVGIMGMLLVMLGGDLNIETSSSWEEIDATLYISYDNKP
jgi:hypothetical protein